MTPKEKSTELIQKFRTEIYRGVITTADWNPKREAHRDEQGRRCALICVNEILEAVTTIADKKYDYYVEVKKELENFNGAF